MSTDGEKRVFKVKRWFWRFFIGILALTSPISAVSAQSNVQQKLQPLLDKIDLITQAARILFVSIFVLALIYAAYLHMTSEGAPEKEAKARKAFMGAVIALIIVLLAPTIKDALINLLS